MINFHKILKLKKNNVEGIILEKGSNVKIFINIIVKKNPINYGEFEKYQGIQFNLRPHSSGATY